MSEPAAASIARSRLRHPGSGWQKVANATYVAAARSIAGILGRHQIVRSITLRRSTAAGEVRFGRSDIDLGLVLHSAGEAPAETRELFILNRTVRRLRRVLPWLGQCEVLAVDELADWAAQEPFRVGLDLDHAVLLHGPPVAFARCPISPGHAAYRTAFWYENYLPRALLTRNRGNLWKFSVEMWTTCSLGLGRGIAPHLGRRETMAAWRAYESTAELPEPTWTVERLWRLMMDLAAETHAALRPPLSSPRRLIAHSCILPPSFSHRTLLIGTAEQLASSLSRLPPDAMPLTPEALDLYLEFVNPALYTLLPPAVRNLGFSPPSAEAWHTVLRRWSSPILARKPGFGTCNFGTSPRLVLYARQAAAALRAGICPPLIQLEELGPAARASLAFRAYFTDHYASVLAAGRATRAQLG